MEMMHSTQGINISPIHAFQIMKDKMSSIFTIYNLCAIWTKSNRQNMCMVSEIQQYHTNCICNIRYVYKISTILKIPVPIL